jgi:hypothetical protein
VNENVTGSPFSMSVSVPWKLNVVVFACVCPASAKGFTTPPTKMLPVQEDASMSIVAVAVVGLPSVTTAKAVKNATSGTTVLTFDMLFSSS